MDKLYSANKNRITIIEKTLELFNNEVTLPAVTYDPNKNTSSESNKTIPIKYMLLKFIDLKKTGLKCL